MCKREGFRGQKNTKNEDCAMVNIKDWLKKIAEKCKDLMHLSLHTLEQWFPTIGSHISLGDQNKISWGLNCDF